MSKQQEAQVVIPLSYMNSLLRDIQKKDAALKRRNELIGNLRAAVRRANRVLEDSRPDMSVDEYGC